MVDLGDFANNPLRIGAWSRVQLKPLVYEIGLCVKVPARWFPLGVMVRLELDGRTFVGQVVNDVEPCKVTLSSDTFDAVNVKLEGRYQ